MAEGVAETGWVEVGLFTDAEIFGQIQIGPYLFINTIQHALGAEQRPSIVLRLRYFEHDNEIHRRYGETLARHYHGGDLFDEVAAVASLLLGVRLKAGPASRENSESDPLGRPLVWDPKAVPLLIRPPRARPQLPHLTQGDLDALEGLKALLSLADEEVHARIKVARLYQDALWMAEAQPELSWILLISALETAASNWKTSARPSERFGLFMQAFKTPLSHTAPSPAFAFEMAEPSYARAMATVYRYRSNYLHEGTAFPLPMCGPPAHYDFRSEGLDSGFEQIPPGLAMSARNARWEKSDTPMLLWTFHELARGALMKWWVPT